MKEELSKITNLKQITDIFLYGSRAYNISSKNSDFDYIVLAKDAINGRQYNNSTYNITTYTPEHFQEKLNENKPFAIECFFLPKEFILLSSSKFNLKLTTYKEEYLRKIKEDEEKLAKFKENYLKIIKTKFFILKLNKQLEWLNNNQPFSFDFKEDFENIKKEPLWL